MNPYFISISEFYFFCLFIEKLSKILSPFPAILLKVILDLSAFWVKPEENSKRSAKVSDSNSSNLACFLTSPTIETEIPVGLINIASFDCSLISLLVFPFINKS